MTKTNRIIHWSLLGIISLFLLLGIVGIFSQIVSSICAVATIAVMWGWNIWKELNE